MTARIALCSAFPPELRSLQAQLAPAYPGADIVTFVTGVGLVDAAIGVTEHLARTPALPDLLVFVGTCGAVDARAIGHVAVPHEATLFSAGVAAGDAAWVEASKVEAAGALVAALAAPHEGLEPALPGIVATVLGITVTTSLAERVAASGAAFEHLEAFSVLRAAARFGVPAACVLGIANQLGPMGREQWRSTRGAAEAAAGARVHAWLVSLGDPMTGA